MRLDDTLRAEGALLIALALYDLMKSIAGSRPIYDERMLRTTQAMYIVHKKISGDALQEVGPNFSRGVGQAVGQCRKSPENKFFIDVFVPAFDAILKR